MGRRNKTIKRRGGTSQSKTERELFNDKFFSELRTDIHPLVDISPSNIHPGTFLYLKDPTNKDATILLVTDIGPIYEMNAEGYNIIAFLAKDLFNNEKHTYFLFEGISLEGESQSFVRKIKIQKNISIRNNEIAKKLKNIKIVTQTGDKLVHGFHLNAGLRNEPQRKSLKKQTLYEHRNPLQPTSPVPSFIEQFYYTEFPHSHMGGAKRRTKNTRR